MNEREESDERIAACADAIRKDLSDYLRESGVRTIDVENAVAALLPGAVDRGWSREEVRHAVSLLADEIQGRMEADLRSVDPATEHPSGYLTRH